MRGHMVRYLILAAATMLAVLQPSRVTAQGSQSQQDVFSIIATTGGYYLRTVSPKGDRITATCQSIGKGAWTFTVAVYPAKQVNLKAHMFPALNLSGEWAYPLQHRDDGAFSWTAPNPKVFALFLHRASGMGWSDRFVSHELNVDFLSHGSDDPRTISAFAHLCRLPGLLPNAY